MVDSFTAYVVPAPEQHENVSSASAFTSLRPGVNAAASQLEPDVPSLSRLKIPICRFDTSGLAFGVNTHPATLVFM
jgi:hypothetical protein